MLRIAILIVSLATGGGAGWLALNMRPASQVTTVVQPAPAPATQDVLVAAVDIGPGERLAKQNVRWQPWPEAMLNPAYITRSTNPAAPETLAGAVLRNRMVSGEPILNEKLISPNAGFLSVMLPSGKRAVAVRISAENTAGGFVLPNDRVDVIHTVERQHDGHAEQLSYTILKNIPVLAIDQTIDDTAKDDKGKDEKGKAKLSAIGKTATLELDPAQVEVIVAAEARGRLSLALRSVADNNEAAATNRQPERETVTVLRGSSASPGGNHNLNLTPR